MTCFTPLQGFESQFLTATGKRKTTFNRADARAGGLFKRILPCNRCSGCRLSYSRGWAIRCCHEASLHEHNSFITLTYNDQFLPRIYSEDGLILGSGNLNFDHWTNFMKRLRRNLSSKSYMSKFDLPIYNSNIRFYMGSEYGDLNLRPHYHAIIFGYDFPDKQFYKEINGHRLYRSSLLESLWSDPDTGESYGYSSVGSCTYQSAAYVARYMMKKVKGDDYDGRYWRHSLITGEAFQVASECARMSNRPGIAHDWFNEFYLSDVYNKDFVTVNGVKYKPPKYYDNLLQSISPDDYLAIKAARTLELSKIPDLICPKRLNDLRLCQESKLKQLPRNLSKELTNVT